MKYIPCILSIVLFVSFPMIEAAELRNWTGSNGKVIQAEFVSYDPSSEIVKIKLKDGREQNVKISLFSKEDQDFVKNQGKSDNPFGETVEKSAPALPTKPIDMKFVADEAKKAMDQFEKDHRNEPGIGNIPTLYVDYAFILKYIGQDSEAKKYIEKAMKLAESVPDDPRYSGNYVWIVKRAIAIGSNDIAQKIMDDNRITGYGLARCHAWLEND